MHTYVYIVYKYVTDHPIWASPSLTYISTTLETPEYTLLTSDPGKSANLKQPYLTYTLCSDMHFCWCWVCNPSKSQFTQVMSSYNF